MKKVVKVYAVAVLVVGFSLMAVNAHAGEGDSAATKLGRGIFNGATCWVEVFKHAYLTAQERDPLTGLVFGAAKGVGYGVVRAASGAFDIATFALPPYDKPLMDPEFVFEGWATEEVEE